LFYISNYLISLNILRSEIYDTTAEALAGVFYVEEAKAISIQKS